MALCALALLSRFLYQRRAERRSLQEKENRQALETAYRTELHLHGAGVRDNMKEYYI